MPKKQSPRLLGGLPKSLAEFAASPGDRPRNNRLFHTRKGLRQSRSPLALWLMGKMTGGSFAHELPPLQQEHHSACGRALKAAPVLTLFSIQRAGSVTPSATLYTVPAV